MHRCRISSSILSLLVLFCGTHIAVAQNTSAAYEDADAYAIYSVILGNEWPVREAKAKRLVIQIETEDYPGFDDTDCLKPEKGEEEKSAPVITAYRSANKDPKLLQRKFDPNVEYELVSKASIRAFFTKKSVAGWKDFYEKYPESGGYIMMSAVGFNADKSLAIVYVGHSCGGLCGGGYYHFLNKIDGKWFEGRWFKGTTCTWAS